jgi:hypothetical protein
MKSPLFVVAFFIGPGKPLALTITYVTTTRTGTVPQR